MNSLFNYFLYFIHHYNFYIYCTSPWYLLHAEQTCKYGQGDREHSSGTAMCLVWFTPTIDGMSPLVNNAEGCMCNELGGGQRWLDSGATGVGRSGSHKEQQTHSGDGI